MYVQQLLTECRSRGMKVTPQRVAIFEALRDTHGHPSADEVFHSVRRRHPSLSFATVYNTLQMLAQFGCIREIIVDELRRRYDLNPHAHHHAVCRGCHAITDVAPEQVPALSALAAADLAGFGFIAEGVTVQFRGLCAGCAPHPAQAASRPPNT
jgi:Fur family peroxide stress response transcriptional regulator